jgi:hypothetical protein
MPIEIVGEFGTPGATSEWIEAEGKLAIRHVKHISGDPPPEMAFPSHTHRVRLESDVDFRPL